MAEYNIEHRYTRQLVEDLLEGCLNKTLGEIDKNNVFNRTKENPKITGIAGDVIEQSVLDMRQTAILLQI